MNTSDRLQADLYTGGTPIWEDGRVVTYTLGKASMKGFELAARLEQAQRFRASLERCIDSMAAILDEGETVAERADRIEQEDRYPDVAAKRAGWFAIEDFAQLCDQSETGFHKFIKDVRGQVVKPRDEITFQRLIGTGWERYPSRGFFYGDYFMFADSWKDALARVRKETKS